MIGRRSFGGCGQIRGLQLAIELIKSKYDDAADSGSDSEDSISLDDLDSSSYGKKDESHGSVSLFSKYIGVAASVCEKKAAATTFATSDCEEDAAAEVEVPLVKTRPKRCSLTTGRCLSVKELIDTPLMSISEE